MRVLLGTAEEDDGEQPLYCQLLVQHLPDGLGFQRAVWVGLRVMEKVDDAVPRCLCADKLDQVTEVQSDVGKLVIARLLGPVEELKGQQILAVVDGIGFQTWRRKRLNDGGVGRAVDDGKRLSEWQGFGSYIEDADLCRVKIAQGGGLAGAGFAQNQNWDSHLCTFFLVEYYGAFSAPAIKWIGQKFAGEGALVVLEAIPVLDVGAPLANR